MTDFADYAPSPISLGKKGDAITPGASDLAGGPKAITCLAAGNVTIVPLNNANGDTLTFTGCPVGFVPPYVVRRVTAATGSWATVLD